MPLGGRLHGMQQISIALKSLSARKAVAKSFSEEGKM
jgi:hypothetical protein